MSRTALKHYRRELERVRDEARTAAMKATGSREQHVALSDMAELAEELEQRIRDIELNEQMMAAQAPAMPA